VLRKLPPGDRENVQVVIEKIDDRATPPCRFPLLGQARLHHCRWKCTVHSEDVLHNDCPFKFDSRFPKVEVVYIDRDHLRPCGGGEEECLLSNTTRPVPRARSNWPGSSPSRPWCWTRPASARIADLHGTTATQAGTASSAARLFLRARNLARKKRFV
jgi:hypothetical protein